MMSSLVKMFCICGSGMESSLIPRITVEAAVDRMGLSAEIGRIDPSSVRSIEPDMVVRQDMRTDELERVTPVIVLVDDFLDDTTAEEKFRAVFTAAGQDTHRPRRRWEPPPTREMPYAPPQRLS